MALATALTGALAWVPTATALTTQLAPTASPAPALTAADGGGVHILKKDPGGDHMPGAAFTLLDLTGEEIATGTTDSGGRLTFEDIPAGVYRLKETSSGSPLHDVVADQDVIVTPGQTAPLTITDPFKPAGLTVTTTDKNSGKPLRGVVINFTPADSGDTVALTTGKDGTAKAQIPVNSRTGTAYTVTNTKAPAGYNLNTEPVKIKATPGSPLAVGLTLTKTGRPAKPPTTSPGTSPPTTPSRTPKPSTATGTPTPPSRTASGQPTTEKTTPSTTAPAPAGSLAHTGADATPWLIGGAAVLLAAGGATVIAARRRSSNDGEDNQPAQG
ncbi:SpaA isopeptide-forming pilin-related protein [Streptomyces sp. NPDC088141]|uniref:SpaA isopeptide-forming pilin-related protein n=1 Tax=Streptomyces sp. NPDC088141 TaxID=3155179 RepID=UPI0034476B12